jgi:hypothetical protein
MIYRGRNSYADLVINKIIYVCDRHVHAQSRTYTGIRVTELPRDDPLFMH